MKARRGDQTQLMGQSAAVEAIPFHVRFAPDNRRGNGWRSVRLRVHFRTHDLRKSIVIRSPHRPPMINCRTARSYDKQELGALVDGVPLVTQPAQRWLRAPP